LGARHKEEALEELMLAYELRAEEIAYMGDDLPDYEVLTRVGLATCPHDAAPEIRHICDYISPIKGGEGCVRDLIEQTLKVQGKWNQASDRNW
jgi:3-deoxy-D-manno-octulosonate 8-phosphate phosphatase (KDO 8-P phosphatase)